MQQLLSGLQHCHDRGVMHRDIKSSNLLIDKKGVLKIADFGLAHSFAIKPDGPLTNRVVTLWYRAPELLLGSTDYGFGIDLWSAGCLLAEMFVGRPIMPGRTEVNAYLDYMNEIFSLGHLENITNKLIYIVLLLVRGKETQFPSSTLVLCMLEELFVFFSCLSFPSLYTLVYV